MAMEPRYPLGILDVSILLLLTSLPTLLGFSLTLRAT